MLSALPLRFCASSASLPFARASAFPAPFTSSSLSLSLSLPSACASLKPAMKLPTRLALVYAPLLLTLASFVLQVIVSVGLPRILSGEWCERRGLKR